jgi:hypothetical protein
MCALTVRFLLFTVAFCGGLLCPSLVRAADDDGPGPQYEEMRAAFGRGEYGKARELGRKLLNRGQLSPELFQLMGNISYRLDDLGAATLYYRRAALFPPPVPEVRQNMVHIKNRTGNLAFARNSFQDQYAGYLSRTSWFTIAFTAAWVAVISFVWALFLRRRNSSLRVFLAFVRVLALIAAVLAGLGWYWRPSYEKLERLAVITVPETQAYSAASVTAGTITKLPPGSEVRRLEDRGVWSYVEIPREEEPLRGWVMNAAFEPLWPYDRGYLE